MKYNYIKKRDYSFTGREILKSRNDLTNWRYWCTDSKVETNVETTPMGDVLEVTKVTPRRLNSILFQNIKMNPKNKKLKFSIWLKADRPHIATIKIQTMNSSESNTSDSIKVTNEWSYYKVTNKFLKDNEVITVVLWPGGFNGTSDAVYAWGASLVQI
ncbi:carbohydrate binding domain-containing protein [Chengkuizengella marina]|uniref:CBM-cenC domain-containing protein n=1 Tax=Chengkuizengella marina TaxID=2507566 RepID=A0A6N9PY70_9BACL|nr:hypothetical protein [Chengkuizengella marina]NBI27917.1 hypothetical protein [Chengkuizengella marina]